MDSDGIEVGFTEIGGDACLQDAGREAGEQADGEPVAADEAPAPCSPQPAESSENEEGGEALEEDNERLSKLRGVLGRLTMSESDKDLESDGSSFYEEMEETEEDDEAAAPHQMQLPQVQTSVLQKKDLTLQRIHDALKTKSYQPDDMGIWYWDTAMFLILIYYAMIIPAQLVVPRQHLVLTEWGHFSIEALFCAALTVDVYVRLNLAVYDTAESRMIVDPKAIRAARLRSGQLVADVLAAVPMDLIALSLLGADASDGYLFIGLSTLRIAGKAAVTWSQLFQVITAVKLHAQSVNYQYSILPNVKMAASVAVSVNTLAVVWIYINQGGVAYATDPEDRYAYTTALYWVLYTVTTVGYGDVPVDTPEKRLFACGVFLIATIAQGTIISKISVRMQKGDVESERVENMKETLLVLKKFNIPEQLANEVLAFQYHKLHSDVQSGFMKTLIALPAVMRCRVGLFVRMKFIDRVQMFKELPVACLIDLAKCLQDVVYEPEEVIMTAGEEGRDMFFLTHGFCQILSPEGALWSVVQPGAAFGEAALMTDQQRSATVETLTYAELFRLDKRDFWKLMHYQELREAVREEMKRRGLRRHCEGTWVTIRATTPFDVLGIQWVRNENGTYCIEALEETGAAYRAGLLVGQTLIEIDGVDGSETDDIEEADVMFQSRGSVVLRLLQPSIEKDQDGAELEAEAEKDGDDEDSNARRGTAFGLSQRGHNPLSKEGREGGDKDGKTSPWRPRQHSRWTSFRGPAGGRGKGGKESNKGPAATDNLPPGQDADAAALGGRKARAPSIDPAPSSRNCPANVPGSLGSMVASPPLAFPETLSPVSGPIVPAGGQVSASLLDRLNGAQSAAPPWMASASVPNAAPKLHAAPDAVASAFEGLEKAVAELKAAMLANPSGGVRRRKEGGMQTEYSAFRPPAQKGSKPGAEEAGAEAPPPLDVRTAEVYFRKEDATQWGSLSKKVNLHGARALKKGDVHGSTSTLPDGPAPRKRKKLKMSPSSSPRGKGKGKDKAFGIVERNFNPAATSRSAGMLRPPLQSSGTRINLDPGEGGSPLLKGLANFPGVQMHGPPPETISAQQGI